MKHFCCYNHFLNLWSNTLHWHCTWISFSFLFCLIKNESIHLYIIDIKVDINNQAIAKIKKIMKEQREKILEQGKKDGEENFYEKSQILQVSRVSMPFKIWSSSKLRYVIFWNLSHASSLIAPCINFWSYTFWSMICCFWS